MDNPQHLAIDAYLKELTELADKRAEVERRAARVEKAVRAMIDLLDGEPEYESYLERFDDVVRPAGLTAAVTAIVQAAGREGLTPMEVRHAASSMLLGHSNPVASVHTILKRIVKSGPFEKTTKNGQAAYRFVSPSEMMVRDMQVRAGESKLNLTASRMTLGQRIGRRAIPPPPGSAESEEKIGTPPSIDNAHERGYKGKK